MNAHTGYVMIDCGGLDLLAESSQTIKGIYEKAEAAMNTGKTVFAANCVWGTTGTVTPIAVLLTTPAGSGTIVATASTLQIWITSEDVVTIANMAPSTT